MAATTKWSKKEVSTLKKHWLDSTDEEICKALPERTLTAIICKAEQLDLGLSNQTRSILEAKRNQIDYYPASPPRAFNFPTRVNPDPKEGVDLAKLQELIESGKYRLGRRYG